MNGFALWVTTTNIKKEKMEKRDKTIKKKSIKKILTKQDLLRSLSSSNQ